MFTIALLTSEFGQVWQDSTLCNMLNTILLCKPGFTKMDTTLGDIVDFGNGVAYHFVKLGLKNLIRL